MKKTVALLLICIMALCLAACGSKDVEEGKDERKITKATTTAETLEEETTEEQNAAAGEESGDVFFYKYKGAKLVPGQPISEEMIALADDSYSVASCAYEGNDTIYTYGEDIEVIVNASTGTELVFDIYFLSPNVFTEEGLSLGDDRATVEQLYGTDYTEELSKLTYVRGDTQMQVILQDDVVVSIELLMVY